MVLDVKLHKLYDRRSVGNSPQDLSPFSEVIPYNLKINNAI